MIYIGNIREVDRGNFDQTWAIVRSLKSRADGITQVQVLSPSWNLFGKYQNLKKQGRWSADTFKGVYVPQFLREMKSEAACAKLNELYTASKAGQRIALLCFCPDERLCHRSIIAGLLQGVGAEVKLNSGADYTEYYRQFAVI